MKTRTKTGNLNSLRNQHLGRLARLVHKESVKARGTRGETHTQRTSARREYPDAPNLLAVDQQGDVLIEQIADIPTGAKRLASRVLREGEATGHAHVAVGEDVELYEKDGIKYARVPHRTTIRHEEHKPVVIEPGLYRITGVREYDHFAEEARHVMD